MLSSNKIISKRFSSELTQNICLINSLIKKKIVKSKEVEEVMKTIDRKDFVDSFYAYAESPQSIGFGATISAPIMHAYALELLKPILVKKTKVLDVVFNCENVFKNQLFSNIVKNMNVELDVTGGLVGSGSGYLTLAFAKMMDHNRGVAYGIEHIKKLVDLSITNVKKNHSKYIDQARVVLLEGDGKQGLEKYAPFDAIHVGAAAEQIPPSLIKQLALGGRMVIPLGKQGYQDYTVIDKDQQGNISSKIILGVSYVPLTSKKEQLGTF